MIDAPARHAWSTGVVPVSAHGQRESEGSIQISRLLCGIGEAFCLSFPNDSLRLIFRDCQRQLVSGIRSPAFTGLYAKFQHVLPSIRSIETERLGKLLE